MCALSPGVAAHERLQGEDRSLGRRPAHLPSSVETSADRACFVDRGSCSATPAHAQDFSEGVRFMKQIKRTPNGAEGNLNVMSHAITAPTPARAGWADSARWSTDGERDPPGTPSDRGRFAARPTCIPYGLERLDRPAPAPGCVLASCVPCFWDITCASDALTPCPGQSSSSWLRLVAGPRAVRRRSKRSL